MSSEACLAEGLTSVPNDPPPLGKNLETGGYFLHFRVDLELVTVLWGPVAGSVCSMLAED